MNLEAKELRIGNWVQINWKTEKEPLEYVKIRGVEYDGDFKGYWFDIENINTFEVCHLLEPIPLTEEWFVKLGAIHDENNDLYIPMLTKTDSDIRFYIVDGYIQKTKSYHCPLANYEHITKVHLFQNLFYSLVGTELQRTN